MKVILAEELGFCFGVKKAINKAIDTIDRNRNVYSLGPLIHNKQVISNLKQKGLKLVESIKDAKESKLIIRSHGISLKTYEKAKQLNIDIIDTTCPFVKNIQEKVKKYYEKGYTIVIVGDCEHPEVKGINGWCNNSAYIINSENNIEDILDYDKICIVAQTTMIRKRFERICECIESNCKDVIVFDTICNATKLRQDACRKLAKQVDAMVVIGGYHSSNTKKLASISKEICDNTYHIETSDELKLEELKNYQKIGITAGASTPDWIIEEAVNKMNDANNEVNEMNEMMKEIEKSMVELDKGSIVKGKVVLVNNDEVMVNIGYKSDGIISKKELTSNPYLNPDEVVKIDDEIEVYVLALDDGEGNVLLSKKRVDDIKNLDKLEEMYNENEIIEGKVIEVVKGGVIVLTNDIRGFIPASHLSISYVDDLNEFLGKTLELKIIEFNKEKRRIILSRKEIEKEQMEKKKEELWNSLEEGITLEGEVKRITNFGAFVDVGGVDGLIHISELSWGRIDHPSEVLKEGDIVEVVVLKFDKEGEKISLGFKQLKPHPWDNVTEKYKEGEVIEGKVVRLVDFGAFVQLKPGLDGLVHISEISRKHIAKASDVLSKGQIIKVKILSIDEDEKRISLSIKEVDSDVVDEQIEKDEKKDNEYKDDGQKDVTIGDVLNK